MTAPVRPHLTTALDPATRARFVHLIDERFGLALAHRQLHDLDQVVSDLLAGGEYESPLTLFQDIATRPDGDLLAAIVARLTVGETHFFRIRPQIQALRHTVLPNRIGARAASRRVCIWIAGCSTGEEAYTVAMLLREQLPALHEWRVEIVATDINASALEAARQGRYGMWSFRETPNEVRERYFALEGKSWQLLKPVRDMVQFIQGNLAGGAVQSLNRLAGEPDLILCRNVTIYFSSQHAQQLYRRLAAELAPGGWLILGPSDPPPQGIAELQPVYLPGAILWRKADPMDAEHGNCPGAADSTFARHASRPASLPAKKPKLGAVHRPRLASHDSPQLPAPAPRGPRQTMVQSEDRVGRSAGTQQESESALDATAHLALGMNHLEKGIVQPALESLRRAAFLDANNAVAHFGLGRAYIQIGNIDRARAAFIHTRRILASIADGSQSLGGGLTVDDLRYVVELQLRALGNGHGE